ncbi:LOB domain-containing protein 13, partial [Cucurbita argyrosperma subsp. argyrosperma]
MPAECPNKDGERSEVLGKKRKRAVSSNIPPRHTLHGPPRTLNTITPCAACKLLRRRCGQQCPFAPYFSPHEPHKFASVHKVFGASNVSKMLKEVPKNERDNTANSLIYEANVRLRDPVYGCMGAISCLQHQVQALQATLTAVRAEILRCKYRQGNMVSIAVQPPPPPPPELPPPPHQDASSSSSTLYNRPTVAADSSFFAF